MSILKRSKNIDKIYAELSDKIHSIESDNILNKEEIISDIVKILNSVDMGLEISTYLALVKNDMKIDYLDGENIKLILKAANYIYTNTGETTGLTDSEYDLLVEKINSQMGENFNPSLGSSNISSDTEYHTFRSLRGTLDKVYYLSDDESSANKSRRGLPEWIKSTEKRIHQLTGKRVNLQEEEIMVFPKFDGVSCIFEFNKNDHLLKALTRGNTETNEAQDITGKFVNFYKYLGDKETDTKPVRGLKTEIMMSEDDFIKYTEKYNVSYNSTRSVISGILNSLDFEPDKLSFISIIPLREAYLDKSGKEIGPVVAPGAFNYPMTVCKLKDIDKIEEFSVNNKYVNGQYRCDGAVIYLTNPKLREILGRLNHRQKSEVAYKFTEEYAYTNIIDVIFQVGLFGKIAPVAVVNPVKLKGNTITRISLGSIGRLNELKLSPGDTVKVLYDIIPYLTLDDRCSRKLKGIFKAPRLCPDCGEELTKAEESDELSCRNKKCPCRQKGKILNYLKKMGIDGISYATVDLLYEERLLRSILDIYYLPDYEKLIAGLPGFGVKSAKKLSKTIKNHMESPISSFQLLGAIGIEGLGLKTFEKVLSVYTFDELLKFAKNPSKYMSSLLVIPGVKDITAKKIIDGINDDIELIKFLRDKLNIVDKEEEIADFSVAFTKIRDSELEDWIIRNGGEVDDQLRKSTDVLIVPSKGVSSSKVSKAKKYNIPVVEIQNAKEYIQKKLVKDKWN